MLHRVLGRTDTERRVAINTIGPFWDGNEVWLIVGGAAIFAAFPGWYATLFSGAATSPWSLLLVGADRARGLLRVPRPAATATAGGGTWSWTPDAAGSALVPLLIGIALGDLLAGLPIDSQRGVHRVGCCDLLTPYGLFVGLTLLVLCAAARRHLPRACGPTGTCATRAHALAPAHGAAGRAAGAAFAVWTPSIADAGRRPRTCCRRCSPSSPCWPPALLLRAGAEGLVLHRDRVAIGLTVAVPVRRTSTRT